MNRSTSTILFASMLVALSGCGGERSAQQPKAAGESTAAESNAATAQAEQTRRQQRVAQLESLSAPGGTLTIRPGGINRCTTPEGPIALEVSWNASALGTEGVHIFLQNPNEERKLWSSAGAVGSGTTGPWMQGGATVTLVNAANNNEVAKLELKEVGCD